jgi:hypothetical protein
MTVEIASEAEAVASELDDLDEQIARLFGRWNRLAAKHRAALGQRRLANRAAYGLTAAADGLRRAISELERAVAAEPVGSSGGDSTGIK